MHLVSSWPYCGQLWPENSQERVEERGWMRETKREAEASISGSS